MKVDRQSLLVLLVLGILVVSGVPAWAQAFPSRAMTIVVPSGAGGPLDLIARLLAPKLEARLGQSVIVDNRVGAGGYLGGEFAVRAPADGHVLVSQAYGGLHGSLFNKAHVLALSKELIPVAGIADTPNIFVVSNSVPAKDLKEFVAYVKANPKKLNMAVFPGTANHLEGASFLRTNGMEMTEVPYNASSAIQTAIVRDEVQMYLTSPTAWIPHVKEGRAKAIAVAGPNRIPQLPDVPTTGELGFNYKSGVYFAVLVSAKTPASLVQRLHAEINAITAMPDVRDTLVKTGLPPAAPATPAQLKAALLAEADTLARTAKEVGIEPK